MKKVALILGIICLAVMGFLASIFIMVFFAELIVGPPYFGFSTSDFIVEERVDTHGGPHGDGEYYLVLDCSKNKEQALENLSGWKKLPLSENLSQIVHGNYGLAKKIPEVENGYYCFRDRHSQSTDSSDDSELFDRSSLNFSMAIYDSDTNKMYYFELDT